MKIENYNRPVGLLFIALTIMYSVGAIASVVRLRYGDEAILNTSYQRVLLPVVIILAGYVAALNFRRIFDTFSIFLLILLVYGATWGIINNGTNYYFAVHAFAMILAISPYLAGRSAMVASASQMRSEIRRMAKIVTAVHVPLMLIYLSWALTGSVYFGMSANILILFAIFFLVEGQLGWATIASVMILATGKRGEIIGLFFALNAWLVIRGSQGDFSALRRAFLGLCAVILLLSLLALSGSTLLDSLTQKFGLFLMADTSDLTSQDTRIAIGGRGTELEIWTETFLNSGPARLVTGLGYGWNIPIASVSGAEVQRLYVVHVSPLNAIAQYGLLLGSALWLWMLFIITKGMTKIRPLPGNNVFVPYLVGMVFVALAAYVVSVDPGFWLCLGACSMFDWAPRDLSSGNPSAPVQDRRSALARV